jgi:hypothetical protein
MKASIDDRLCSAMVRGIGELDGFCPCCKQGKRLFSLQAYQIRRNPRPERQAKRKLEKAPVRPRAQGQWPASVRFD